MGVLHFRSTDNTYWYGETFTPGDGIFDVSAYPDHVAAATARGVHDTGSTVGVTPMLAELPDPLYLSSIIDVQAAYEYAAQHPGMAAKRKPTLLQAQKVIVDAVQMQATNFLSSFILPQITEMYDAYKALNGEPDGTDDYGEGVDKELEALFQPYEKYLSQNFLGTETIDSRLWEDNAIATLADNFGKEVFKQLTYGKEGPKSPAQVLANAGITNEQIATWFTDLQASAQTPEAAAATKEASASTAGELVQKVRNKVGLGADIMALYDEFDMAATENDDILAYGAGERIGLTAMDVEALRNFSLEHGSDTANKLIELFNETEPQGKTGKPAKAPKEPKAEKPQATAADGSLLNGQLILTALKNHSAVKDTDLAVTLGISRASYNNYATGKSPFKPTPDQIAVIRARLVEDANGLYAALCSIDGVPFEPLATA